MPATLIQPTSPVVAAPSTRSPYALPVLLQGVYFLITGLWGALDIVSFQAVTGPKNDLWLVRTVSLLITAMGAAMLVSGWRGRVVAETKILALGSASALFVIDLVYVLKGTISAVYLLDALIEAAFIGWWVWIAIRRGTESRRVIHFPTS